MTISATKILGYHILMDAIVRPSIDEGRRLLRAFERHGFTSIFGDVLRLVDEKLGEIPFRPLIEISGCDVFVNENRNSWIFCKVSGFSAAIPLEGGGDYIEFVIVSLANDSAALEVLTTICREHFGAEIKERLLQERYRHYVFETEHPNRSYSGKLLADKEVREELRRRYDSPAAGHIGAKAKLPKGLWLESMVGDAFESIGEKAQVGIQAGIDEVDVIVNPFGYPILVECKDSNLKLNDVAVAKEKARRLGIHDVILIVTDDDIHPNLLQMLDVWKDYQVRPNGTSKPFPLTCAYVVHSYALLQEFLENLVLWMKLELLATWIQAEDTRPIIPWFSSKDSWGQTIPRASDWYSGS